MKKIFIILMFTAACNAEDLNPYPNKSLTPGAVDPKVTQENIDSTICTHEFNAGQRPSRTFAYRLKVQQIKEYGYSITRTGDYSEDHLVPIAVGGSPVSKLNLWPQPKNTFWSDRKKDALEVKMWNMVCKKRISLNEAQQIFINDWIAGYKQFVK